MNSIVLDILKANQATTLDSEMEIEDCIGYISEINKRLEFLKRLKEKRMQEIEKQFSSLETRRDLLKTTIFNTLKQHGHKSLNFPGVGKVAIKKTPDKWEIIDENKLIEVLTEKLKDEECEMVIKRKIQKSELNKILDVWEPQNKIPNCVKKEEGIEGVSVTVDKSIDAVFEDKKNADIVDVINDMADVVLDSGFDKLDI
jgi:copper chaperone CopZ